MKIAIISDTHLAHGAKDFTANCLASLAWIDKVGADLVIHLGDITLDGVNDPAQFAFARDILSNLRTPLHLVPGNHDVGDNPSPGVEATEPPPRADQLALYRETFGPDHWVLVLAGWTLIGLNSLIFGLGNHEEEAQFAWLDQTLAAATGPVGLLLHKPLFRNDAENDERHPRYVPRAVRARLLAKLAPHDLRFVLCGHTHQLRFMQSQGVDHLWAPSTAFVLPDSLQEPIGEKEVGVMMLTLMPDDHRAEFHAPPGMARHDILNYETLFPQIGEMRKTGMFTRRYR